MSKLAETSGKSIMVPPGIPIKPIIRSRRLVGREVIGGLPPGQSAEVDFRVEYSEVTGQFQVASFGVDRAIWEFEVSGALLRTVKVHAIVHNAIYEALPSWGRTILHLRLNRAIAEARGIPALRPSDDDALLLTAMVYRLAQLSGETPALAVSEALGLKTRTATNWIQRARAAGYMSSLEHAHVSRLVARKYAPYVDLTLAPGITELADSVASQFDEESGDGDG